jgi:hypothetical protein
VRRSWSFTVARLALRLLHSEHRRLGRYMRHHYGALDHRLGAQRELHVLVVRPHLGACHLQRCLLRRVRHEAELRRQRRRLTRQVRQLQLDLELRRAYASDNDRLQEGGRAVRRGVPQKAVGVVAWSEHQDAWLLAAVDRGVPFALCAPTQQRLRPCCPRTWLVARAFRTARPRTRRSRLPTHGSFTITADMTRGNSPPPRTSRRQDSSRRCRECLSRVCLFPLHAFSAKAVKPPRVDQVRPTTAFRCEHTIDCGSVHTRIHHASAGGRASTASEAGSGWQWVAVGDRGRKPRAEGVHRRSARGTVFWDVLSWRQCAIRCSIRDLAGIGSRNGSE